MTMEMHMIHVMRGMTENITAYTMIILPSLIMDHIRGPGNSGGPGTPFTTHNSGFGDLVLGALLRLYTDDNVNFGHISTHWRHFPHNYNSNSQSYVPISVLSHATAEWHF